MLSGNQRLMIHKAFSLLLTKVHLCWSRIPHHVASINVSVLLHPFACAHKTPCSSTWNTSNNGSLQVNKPKSHGSRLKAWASISASPSSQKLSLSPGFQAEPGPHITSQQGCDFPRAHSFSGSGINGQIGWSRCMLQNEGTECVNRGSHEGKESHVVGNIQESCN